MQAHTSFQRANPTALFLGQPAQHSIQCIHSRIWCASLWMYSVHFSVWFVSRIFLFGDTLPRFICRLPRLMKCRKTGILEFRPRVSFQNFNLEFHSRSFCDHLRILQDMHYVRRIVGWCHPGHTIGTLIHAKWILVFSSSKKRETWTSSRKCKRNEITEKVKIETFRCQKASSLPCDLRVYQKFCVRRFWIKLWFKVSLTPVPRFVF